MTYLYWYKFLQHAERDPDKQVDWKKYRAWGGKGVVMNTKFDAWWQERWKKLFGIKEQGDTPKYPLTKFPKGDGIRYSLLCYEYRDKGSNWEIAIQIQKREIQNRIAVPLFAYAIEGLNTKTRLKKSDTRKRIKDESNWKTGYRIINRDSASKKVERDTDPEAYLNAQEKRMIQGYVSRYKKDAHKMMDNICNGMFP